MALAEDSLEDRDEESNGEGNEDVSEGSNEDRDDVYPVFCNAHIPAEILEVVQACRDDDYSGVLRIVDTLDTPAIKAAARASGTSIKEFSSPFLGWTVDQLYDYWKQHFRNPQDEQGGDWTSYTFCILDSQSSSDKAALVCSDAPDFGEAEDEIVLKTLRVPFREIIETISRLELLNICPSEYGKDFVISVMPPPIFDMSGFPPGSGMGVIATPEVARRNKAVAIKGLTNEDAWPAEQEEEEEEEEEEEGEDQGEPGEPGERDADE